MTRPSLSSPLALSLRGGALFLLAAWTLACSGVQSGGSGATAVGASLDLQSEQLADGQPFDLSSQRGKVCIVDVWASWCAPCRLALPFFAELHGRLATRGLSVVALSVDEDQAAAKAFVDSMKLPFVVLWDRGQKNVARLNVPKMPTSFLLDAQGRVRKVYAGFNAVDREVIEADVVALLAEAATGTATPP